MRASISVPFVDTCADDLVWTLGHPPVDPLASRTLRVAGARIELRVLGASHQVVVTPEPTDAALISPGSSPAGEPVEAAGTTTKDLTADEPLVETVACLPGLPGGLPSSTERPHMGGYRFDSSVESLSPTELAHRVDRLHREVSGSPSGLLVTFPGDHLAITALHLTLGSGEQLHWRTWHAYPQSGELVTTMSTVTP
ncbi:DUF2617 family protein [Nocardiopsis sp. ATB16-24]|uniref:DUF2617 family protein n=1 Tax=Nocardiopsis sp. ATB16-24 TaxID=3019555 RepID=UPI0025521A90|nr:DUF2617 family protein [Nocardiopsis sp. ATB16-24]